MCRKMITILILVTSLIIVVGCSKTETEETETEEIEVVKQENTPEQIALLKEEYKTLLKEYDDLWDKKRKEDEIANSKCSKCSSEEILTKIVMVQEDSWNSLDTLEVLKCGKCGNEWKPEKVYYGEYAIVEMFKYFYWYFEGLDNAENATFDSQDLSERYSSLEEKRNTLLEGAEYYYQKKDDLLKRYHTETVMWFLDRYALDIPSWMEEIEDWPRERFDKWGCKKF